MDQVSLRSDALCVVTLTVVLALLGGCAGSAPATGAAAQNAVSSGDVHEIVDLRLLSSPTPVAFEQEGDPVGVWAQVYALAQGRSRAVALPPGELELLVFDGSMRASQAADAAPMLTLRYNQTMLQSAGVRTLAGVRYSLPVRWDDHAPQSGIVTIIARFVAQRPGSQPVYSPAVTVRLKPT